LFTYGFFRNTVSAQLSIACLQLVYVFVTEKCQCWRQWHNTANIT